MSLEVASLNSGSNGNCYYIGNQYEAVLIDAGISCRETEQRMKRLDLSMKKIKAIFITHEHSDHINGLNKLVKKYKIPFYITRSTRRNQALEWSDGLAIHFNAYEPIQVGTLTITALPKFHDANDPHSFVVSYNSINIGVFTDAGRVCDHLIRNFKICHAAFLESNYDEDMLEHGGYPLHLKNRIRGGVGHLSNIQALQLFLTYRPPFMSHLFLSHLSKNNNSPELAANLFDRVAGNTKVIVAPRTSETALFQIGVNQIHLGEKYKVNSKHSDKSQLSIFEI